MSKTQEFLKFLDVLMAAAPEVTETMSESVKNYIEDIRNGKNSKKSEKPILTDNGKMLLEFLKSNSDIDQWKASEIGEGIGWSGRAVSGAIRKLITDGFVEKVCQNPTIYSLTEKGKTFDINRSNLVVIH